MNKPEITPPSNSNHFNDGTKAGQISLAALPDLLIKAGNRKVKLNREYSSVLVSGKNSRVGGRFDLRHAFIPEKFKELTGGKSDFREADVRKEMTGPLLIIYLLRGYEVKPDIRQVPYRNGLVLPALGLHFPGSEDPDAPKNLVSYRLTRVAQKELLPDLDDEDSGDNVDGDD